MRPLPPDIYTFGDSVIVFGEADPTLDSEVVDSQLHLIARSAMVATAATVNWAGSPNLTVTSLEQVGVPAAHTLYVRVALPFKPTLNRIALAL